MQYIPIHCHSEFSLLDSLATIEDYVKKCLELKIPAFCITDHGNIAASIQQTIQAKKAGLKPIIGCEMYIVDDRHKKDDNKRLHINIIAKNEEGWKNLVKIVSDGNSRDSFYYRPRTDFNFLFQNSEGLIVTSACSFGILSELIYTGKTKELEDRVQKFQQVFKDDFYMEIMAHKVNIDGRILQQEHNYKVMELSQKFGVKVITTTDSHYIEKEDDKYQRMFTKIGSENSFEFREGDTFYFPSREQLISEYQENLPLFYEKYSKEIETSLNDTFEIAEKCTFELKLKNKFLPKFKWDDGVERDPQKELVRLVEEGFERKIQEGKIPDIDLYAKRVQMELDLFKEGQIADYFLLVWDILQWCHKNDIKIGNGRGSVSASMALWCLGLHEADPIKYKLYFERFLNPTRIKKSTPDVDQDISASRRDEVKEYIKQKYGEENVCTIGTYGRMGIRSAIKGIANLMEIPFQEINELTKLIPFKSDVDEMMSDSSEDNVLLTELIKQYNAKYPELFKATRKVLNKPRSLGKHACGILISDKKIDGLLPIYDRDVVQTQWEMQDIDEIGFLKLDVLGLKTLDVINDTVKMIKQTQAIDVDISNIDYEDPKLYEIVKEGYTLGVFQFEGYGIRQFVKEFKPESLSELCMANAIWRPVCTSVGLHKVACERKANKEELHFKYPIIKEILGETYGLIIYQEQAMEISHKVGGLTLSEADDVRKAIKSFNIDFIRQFKERFLKNAIEVIKMDPEYAETLWKNMEAAGNYGFNKAHSLTYSMLGVQCLYLKRYYPLEFFTVLLRYEQGEAIPSYLSDMKTFGIQCKFPDINISRDIPLVHNKMIYLQLRLLKNLGDSAVHFILEERDLNGKYKDLNDFLNRMDSYLAMKKRKAIIEVFDKMRDAVIVTKKEVQVFDDIKNKRFDNIEKLYKDAVKLFGDKMDKFKIHNPINVRVVQALIQACLFGSSEEDFNEAYKVFYEWNQTDEKERKIFKQEQIFKLRDAVYDFNVTSNIELWVLLQDKAKTAGIQISDKTSIVKRVKNVLMACKVESLEERDKNGWKFAYLKVSNGVNTEKIFVHGNFLKRTSSESWRDMVGNYLVLPCKINEKYSLYELANMEIKTIC